MVFETFLKTFSTLIKADLDTNGDTRRLIDIILLISQCFRKNIDICESILAAQSTVCMDVVVDAL